MAEKAGRYDRIAIALHWLIALGILAQIALGAWMIGIPKDPPGFRADSFNLHKSMGITLGLLVLLRLAWRVAHPPPALPATLPTWQRRIARANHLLLYACLVVMPSSGLLGSIFSGYPIRFFGLRLPALAAKNEPLKELLSALHWGTALVFVTLIAIHVLAAVRHRLIDRDGVFERMWPRPTPAGARGAIEPVPPQGR